MDWDEDDFDYPIDDDYDQFVFTISFPDISTVKELLEKAKKTNFPYEGEAGGDLRVGITVDDVPVIILNFNEYNHMMDDPLTVEECWKKIEASMVNALTGLKTQFEYEYNHEVNQEFSWLQACEKFWPEEAENLKKLQERWDEEIRKMLDLDLNED